MLIGLLQFYFMAQKLRFFDSNKLFSSRGRQLAKTLIIALTSGDAFPCIACRLLLKGYVKVLQWLKTNLWRSGIWSPLWIKGL